MKRNPSARPSRRGRYYAELLIGAAGLGLFFLTLVTREWIELVTGWDPDGGSGSLELAIALGLLAASATGFTLARLEAKRPSTSTA
jgi:hypothetical protein